MSRYLIMPKIIAVLNAHFPATISERFEAQAEEIYDEWSLFSALEDIERSDRHPTKDIKGLEKAVTLLKRAAVEFSEVGWHGSKALDRPAKQLMFAKDDGLQHLQLTALEAPAFFVEHLHQIAASVAHVIPNISEHAPSVNTAFGEGPGFERNNNKPKKTGAAGTAEKCFDVFEKLSGKTATVPALGGKAYGPFLSFVTDVFNALEIKASPEARARSAIRINRPKS
ncbi:hypothetical protein C1J03_03135 [Sulfitobacter sp. SK012]|uniref:hypothetical protein n=1 Tax=Sulfitobacter sp. SK012 TaxID=1389005 RepID=UPI000E0C4B02|nr:hypothetical protein [Sulfitobacter sp. SK012]AXI45117.1 hypothetical protein C1J03_03135 [Sulfitobacter sp. SK012]